LVIYAIVAVDDEFPMNFGTLDEDLDKNFLAQAELTV
jgi:hypothetical protein